MCLKSGSLIGNAFFPSSTRVEGLDLLLSESGFPLFFHGRRIVLHQLGYGFLQILLAFLRLGLGIERVLLATPLQTILSMKTVVYLLAETEERFWHEHVNCDALRVKVLQKKPKKTWSGAGRERRRVLQ